LRTGKAADAARVLEDSGIKSERVIDRALLDVARALLPEDPVRARKLAEPVCGRRDRLAFEEECMIVNTDANGTKR